MQQRPPSFGLNLAGLSPTIKAASKLRTASKQPLLVGLSPTMNAAAATLFWSQFSRPLPDDESSRLAASFFWAQFGRPHPGDECSTCHPLLGSIPAASYLQRTALKQPLMVSIRVASIHVFFYFILLNQQFSSGLRGRRRTYHSILKLADHALSKMVRYVLLHCDL
jgi:hypothetical protein